MRLRLPSSELKQRWPPGLFKRGLRTHSAEGGRQMQPEMCWQLRSPRARKASRRRVGWKGKGNNLGELQRKTVPGLAACRVPALRTDGPRGGSPTPGKGVGWRLGLLGGLRQGLVPWAVRREQVGRLGEPQLLPTGRPPGAFGRGRCAERPAAWPASADVWEEESSAPAHGIGRLSLFSWLWPNVATAAGSFGAGCRRRGWG